MRERTPQRTMALAIFIAAVSYFNFTRIQGSECIRVVHILTLLVCGMGIGIFVSAFRIWLKNRQQQNQP